MKSFALEFFAALAAVTGLTVLALLWSFVVFGLGTLLPLRNGQVMGTAATVIVGVALGLALGSLLQRRLGGQLRARTAGKAPAEDPGHQSGDEVI